MAVISVNIEEIVENCPEFTIPDGTNYPTELVFPYSDFKFHDYTGGLPGLNGTYTFDTFVFGQHSFTGVTIEVETDGAGNIIIPETQYRALMDDLNAASDNDQVVEFIQPEGTSYRDWYLRIYSDNPTYTGQSVSVNSTAGVTPLFTTISSNVDVSVRNLTLLDKDLNVIDLGAISQVDTLELTNSTYTEGEDFTVSFCNEDVVYTITSSNSAECVAKGIAEAVNAVEDTSVRFYNYVSAEAIGNTVVFTSKEAGIPLNLTATYTPGGFTLVNTIANNPSMGVPNITTDDFVTYEAQERGGKYTAILTVVSDCDYNTNAREFFNWCYDLSNFDCCFVKLVKNTGCCCKTKQKQTEASFLRNVIYSLDKMLEKGQSESEIQSVIDFGWSICQPLKCSCESC